MAVQVIHDRLLGIQQMLLGVHQASDPLSSNSKGTEREAFINGFLREVMPPSTALGLEMSSICPAKSPAS